MAAGPAAPNPGPMLLNVAATAEKEVSKSNMEWITLDKEIGTVGSEGGTIIRDEEYEQSCRVTLEKCPKYYAITCGVYGAMVHTVFLGESDCNAKYGEIKLDLQNFIDRIDEMTEDERIDFYEAFCDKYW